MHESGLSRTQILSMTAAGAMIAANRYYCQPLLEVMARSLHLSAETVGMVPTLTQFGAAGGLVLFVPLGDILERRRIMLALLVAGVVGLALTALAGHSWELMAGALLIGWFASVSQLMMGFAASLTPLDQRGRTLGTLTGGFLVGVLGSRVVSGLIGGAFGWRAMYWIAAGTMALLACAMAALLPESRPQLSAGYFELMHSMVGFIRDWPQLRRAAAMGALAFAAMNAFWATLVFYLAGPPYHLGVTTAGLLGLAGVAGALAAPLVGRQADRRSPETAHRLALAIGVTGFIALWVLGRFMLGLIAGIILIDMATQANLVLNQRQVYLLSQTAANRMNTVFISSYFAGGAAGAAIGTSAWVHFGWPGVCAAGILLFGSALAIRSA